MKTAPTESLGLGEEYKRQQQSIVQELHQYPLEGIDFVKTALQSAPVRTRNFAVSVLETWVSAKRLPLSELLPDTFKLLCRLCDIEVREDIKTRMDSLIGG